MEGLADAIGGALVCPLGGGRVDTKAAMLLVRIPATWTCTRVNAITERSDRERSDRDDSNWRQHQPDDASPDDDVIDIKALLRTVWRRRGVILGSIVLLCGLAVLWLVQITPRYTSTALMTIDPRTESVVDIEAVVSGLSPDTSVINTELDVLSSRRLVGKLVDTEGLLTDPEFNSALEPENPLTRLLDPETYLSPEWLAALGLRTGEEETLSEAERREQERARVVDAVTEALRVSNPGLSYTIRIAFETESGKKSAALANALAKLYLTDQLEAKYEATERATNWLNDRIGSLRDRVREAELAVQSFREQNQIVQASQDVTVLEQQLAELNSQLIEAETDLAEAEARYGQVRDMARRGAIAALGDVLKSTLIQRLREQEAEVRRRQADVSSRYGNRHPDVAKVRAELSDIRGKIAEEVNKIVTSVGNEVQVARSRARSLQAKLDDLKAISATIDKARVQLRELEREADSSRTLLETFLSRFKETASQENLQQADARVISRAEVPVHPSFPNKKLILAVVFVLAVMVGLGLTFLLELLDHGYRTLDHLQKETHLKGLGMVPRLSRGELRGKTPIEYVLRSPTSAYAEALRSAHTTLTFGQAAMPKTVVVTSTLPDEGKTTLGLSLARLLARAGNRRVLFVEADLRRGDIGGLVSRGQTQIQYVDDFLAGTVPKWKDCVVTDKGSNLDMILASGKCENAQALLHSEAMATLVRESRDDYDFIIYDSPPLLAVSDAILLSRQVDTTVMVVKWEATPREGVLTAISVLRKADVHVSGVVMTQVDAHRHARYGYRDNISYYKRYGHYYAN